MGTDAFGALVVTTSLQEPAGSASLFCTTNGAVPPVQLKFTFVPARVMDTVMALDTVITAAS